MWSFSCIGTNSTIETHPTEERRRSSWQSRDRGRLVHRDWHFLTILRSSPTWLASIRETRRRRRWGVPPPSSVECSVGATLLARRFVRSGWAPLTPSRAQYWPNGGHRSFHPHGRFIGPPLPHRTRRTRSMHLEQIAPRPLETISLLRVRRWPHMLHDSRVAQEVVIATRQLARSLRTSSASERHSSPIRPLTPTTNADSRAQSVHTRACRRPR